MAAGLDPEPAIDLVHYRRTFRAALRFGIGVGGGTGVLGPKRGTEPGSRMFRWTRIWMFDKESTRYRARIGLLESKRAPVGFQPGH